MSRSTAPRPATLRRVSDDGRSFAIFSPCERYRFALQRIWNPDRPLAMFIGLNPSTADENKNDPTVRRCVGYAMDWGFGGLRMANVFAYRSTDQSVLRRLDDPVGDKTDAWLTKMGRDAGVIVAAWGRDAWFSHRAAAVARRFEGRITCLGRNQDGSPKHPLYLRKDAQRVAFVLTEP